MLYNEPKVAVSSLKETLISCSARAEVAENKKAQSPPVTYRESQGKLNGQSHSVCCGGEGAALRAWDSARWNGGGGGKTLGKVETLSPKF